MLGESRPETVSRMIYLATLYEEQSNLEDCEALYLSALVIQRDLLDESHPDTLETTNQLIRLYRFQSKFDKLDALYLTYLD